MTKTHLRQEDLTLAVLQALTLLSARLVQTNVIDKEKLIDDLKGMGAGLRIQGESGRADAINWVGDYMEHGILDPK